MLKSSCRLSLLHTENKRSHRTTRSLASRYAEFVVCHTCAYKKGTSERASERDNESKRDRGDRAIDKTPNAARPRLILQAYTHPLVFSLSSPTTHPLDHYPPPPPPPLPPPPLLSSSAPASFSATLHTPLTLRKSPSYPLRAPPSPNATHPLRESPRTLGAADILRLSVSLLFSFSLSFYLFSTLHIFCSSFSTFRLL